MLMMRKVLALIAFMILGFYSKATHIVGGEFEIIHLFDDTYLIRQIQYFDEIQGNPLAKDDSVAVSIFRSSDDFYIRNVTLYPISEENVPYSNPLCNSDQIQTSRLVYEATVTLDPEQFDDPKGYYLVWERCCRNNGISNIVEPEYTGQTFFLEFPTLMKNGERFINSSPQLFPPLSDYACVNQFYYADFRGYDRDGDSLSYTLVTPLGSSEDGSPPPAVPPPKPKPHRNITWVDGFSRDNQVHGNPSLEISEDGILTVTPSDEGLFVFSVMCEEFRNGEKIGEVRRDFQLFVVDCPDPGTKPEVKAKAPGSDTYVSDLPPININYGDNSCFSIIVNDPDSNEYIRVRAIPVNFSDSLADHFSINEGIVLDPTDTFKTEFCFPQCINGTSDPAIIDLIVYDNRCPQSLMDTIRIEANMQQPPNNPPEITSPALKFDTLIFHESEIVDLTFRSIDADNDSLSMRMVPIGFDVNDFAIAIDTVKTEKGEIEYELNWNTNCLINPYQDQTQFDFMIIAEDYDECLKNNSDTVYYSININLPPNNPPKITINGEEEDLFAEIRIEELRDFVILATDQADDDSLFITANPIDFELSDLGLTFSETGGNGFASQTLNWQVNCGAVDIMERNTFEIEFIAEDFDRCNGQNADTISLLIKLLPPENSPPELTVDGNTEIDTLEFIIGQNIDVKIDAIDPDGDMVRLQQIDLDSLSELLGFSFEIENGMSSAFGAFLWKPGCDKLNNGFEDTYYTMTYVAADNKCFAQDTTYKELTIALKDIHVDYDFLPPNAFTPNSEDNINPVYYIPDLPGNNCYSQFEEIIIFNRWGQEVYRSNRRDFQWGGDDRSSGVYYYTLIYSHDTFKGIINLVR